MKNTSKVHVYHSAEENIRRIYLGDLATGDWFLCLDDLHVVVSKNGSETTVLNVPQGVWYERGGATEVIVVDVNIQWLYYK